MRWEYIYQDGKPESLASTEISAWSLAFSKGDVFSCWRVGVRVCWEMCWQRARQVTAEAGPSFQEAKAGAGQIWVMAPQVAPRTFQKRQVPGMPLWTSLFLGHQARKNAPTDGWWLSHAPAPCLTAQALSEQKFGPNPILIQGAYFSEFGLRVKLKNWE